MLYYVLAPTYPTLVSYLQIFLLQCQNFSSPCKPCAVFGNRKFDAFNWLWIAVCLMNFWLTTIKGRCCSICTDSTGQASSVANGRSVWRGIPCVVNLRDSDVHWQKAATGLVLIQMQLKITNTMHLVNFFTVTEVVARGGGILSF